MRFIILYLFEILLISSLCAADTNDQVTANLDYGTFKSLSARVRPRFRYWLPDASVDHSTVQDNIKSAGAIGAGGVEFLPFYNYGAQLGASPPGADWSTYGFGTKEFKEIFLAALRAHKDAGLQMDFPLGPNQGQGVPAEPDDEGLQWDLVGLSTNIFYEPTFTIQGTILRCCSEEWSLRRNHPRMGLRRASRAGLSSGHLVSKL